MDNRKIIKIVPADDVFHLTWNTGIRCNYDCMYCPTKLHDATSKHDSLESLQTYWKSILEKTQKENRKYKLVFTGGEVTVNKNFKPFIVWLNENYKNEIWSTVIVTNGSASLKYYTDLFNYVDTITFSLHSEHVNEKKFFNTMLTLSKTVSKTKFIHVNIMDEYWNQDRIKHYAKILDDNKISHSVNAIDYSKQNRKEIIFKGKLNLEIPKSFVS